MKSRPLIVAHRGFSARFPENTMAAFFGALEAGAQMIELDVHLTRDGALIVTHDFELGRTSSGAGSLSDHSSAELRRLDAGSWFGAGFQEERFPVLGQVLAFAKGNVELNLELKEETLVSPSAYEAMATKTLELVERHNMLDKVLISSFDWKMLSVLREKNSRIRLGLLNHEPEKDLRWKEAAQIGAYSYHPHFKNLTASLVREISEKGLLLFPYTANTNAEFERLVILGADGIITNEVALLKFFLESQT